VWYVTCALGELSETRLESATPLMRKFIEAAKMKCEADCSERKKLAAPRGV